MIKTTPKIYPEIVDSIRFYFMLTIVMSSTSNYSDEECSKSFDAFIKELRDNQNYSGESIQANVNVAYKSVPSEFLKLFHIPSVRDDIKFQERAHWKRR